MRKVSTTEALMTDPTTPEGAAYWQQRREFEERAEQAGMDLVADHPFEPATFKDAWPGICGHEVDGLPCGHDQAEHVDQGEE